MGRFVIVAYTPKPGRELPLLAAVKKHLQVLPGRAARHRSAGLVMAMRPLLVHASSKSAVPARRRVLHVEYTPTLSVAPGLTLRVA